MVIKGSTMKSLTKYFGIIACLVGLNSNVFAATSSSVQLDTAIPPADGLLTTDQIPPMFLPKPGAAPSADATAPAPADTQAAPSAS
jgi:hypothetical protein